MSGRSATECNRDATRCMRLCNCWLHLIAHRPGSLSGIGGAAHRAELSAVSMHFARAIRWPPQQHSHAQRMHWPSLGLRRRCCHPARPCHDCTHDRLHVHAIRRSHSCTTPSRSTSSRGGGARGLPLRAAHSGLHLPWRASDWPAPVATATHRGQRSATPQLREVQGEIALPELASPATTASVWGTPFPRLPRHARSALSRPRHHTGSGTCAVSDLPAAGAVGALCQEA